MSHLFCRWKVQKVPWSVLHYFSGGHLGFDKTLPLENTHPHIHKHTHNSILLPLNSIFSLILSVRCQSLSGTHGPLFLPAHTCSFRRVHSLNGLNRALGHLFNLLSDDRRGSESSSSSPERALSTGGHPWHSPGDTTFPQSTEDHTWIHASSHPPTIIVHLFVFFSGWRVAFVRRVFVLFRVLGKLYRFTFCILC